MQWALDKSAEKSAAELELLEVADAPQLGAAVDVLPTFTELESKVMALAKAVPEDKYSWRPGRQPRSYRAR